MTEYINFERPIDEFPRVCIAIPNEINLEFYDISEKCPCGSTNWKKTDLRIKKLKDIPHELIPVSVEICASCKEYRLAKIKNKYLKVINDSDSLIKALRKFSNNENHWINVLANAYAKIKQLEATLEKKK